VTDSPRTISIQVESVGGKEETLQFVSRSAKGDVAAKECGGRGEKEFFDKSFESIKKLGEGAQSA
jgi:hypothetical protein